MRGVVIEPITVDEEDRTADITVQVYTDAGVAYSTGQVLVPIDAFNEAMVIDKIKDLLREEIRKASPIPLTEQEVKDRVLNLQVTVLG